MKESVFSFFKPPVTRVVPSGKMTLQGVSNLIHGGTLQEDTELIRKYYTAMQDCILRGDEEGAKSYESLYKMQKRERLPFVTFSGIFSKRNARGLESFSHLVVIDIDHVSRLGLEMKDIARRIWEDKEAGVSMIFRSPSGDGLKIVCRVKGTVTDGESFKPIFNSLLYYISSRHNLPIGEEGLDPNGSDLPRGCWICYNETTLMREDAQPFDPELHPAPVKERTFEKRYNPGNMEGEFDLVPVIVERIERTGRDIAPERGDWIKLVYSFASMGEEGREYLHRVSRLSGKYNERDTDSQFEYCLQNGDGHIGTFINMARDNGINVYKSEDGTPASWNNNSAKRTPDSPTPSRSEENGNGLEKYMEIPDLRGVASKKREGVPTPYVFEGGGRSETLTLRRGAVTLICGKSSHGKSKFLQNLALNIARQKDGVVLYFTYEEDLGDVLLQFANMYIGTEKLSRNDMRNTDVIREYYRDGSLENCGKKETFIKRADEFQRLHKDGYLRVYSPDLGTIGLCEVVEYLCKQMDVKAVFVDYIQTLNVEGFRRERREEMREISRLLCEMAIKQNIPVVLAAQLNRETRNPVDMSEDNIAESADITRYANTIVCLWNSAFDNVRDGKENFENSMEGGLLKSRGFVLGEAGQIYAKLAKNRGGAPYLSAILDFTPETGEIHGNNDLPEDTPLSDEERDTIGLI